jgi:hypothetical protein
MSGVYNLEIEWIRERPGATRLIATRLASRSYERGQLVLVDDGMGVPAFCIVLSCRPIGPKDEFTNFIYGAIDPDTPDSIIKNKYGKIRIYHWDVPGGLQAVYWVRGSKDMHLSTDRKKVGEELKQAFTESFWERVEK